MSSTSNVINGAAAATENDAPEWLVKLENRREKLQSRGRLLHELGAGAPCADCGDKCPGLDLHFWRKVCRNCKCRKETHCVSDDELAGWAQYEVLGQIRSKPAFINIKKLANHPIKVEWVPPNTSTDIVSDYMQKLGPDGIPVVGSEAAKKRKQKLEFQMPLHDLDASLCHNLTESEALQLQQYVQKIRANCVGQGNVVRVGNLEFANILFVSNIEKPEYATVMAALNEIPRVDPVLTEILSAEKLAAAIVHSPTTSAPKLLSVFAKPITDASEFQLEPRLSNATKAKLYGIDKRTLASLIYNGPIYDKILGALKDKNFDISRDPILGAIDKFRTEYAKNSAFKAELDHIADTLAKSNNRADYTTPVKSKIPDYAFNSPQPLKQHMQTRLAEQLQQETPMRKVKFGHIEAILHDCGLPANIAYEQDPVFYQIINSTQLKRGLEQVQQGLQPTPVIVAVTPLQPDFVNEPVLSPIVKNQLNDIPVNKQALQSALLNGPFYDQLFDTLQKKKIDYGSCRLLAPLKHLRSQLLNNQPLCEEVRAYIAQKPDNYVVSYGSPEHALKSALTGSRSNDSGFDSVPTTPSAALNELQAMSGKFVTIPGIEDVNMYSDCKPASSKLSQDFENMKLTNQAAAQKQKPAEIPLLKCNDCVLPINLGEVAVKAERAGQDIAWHPECFKCHSCRELLVDLVYFFHGGRIYCGRDLAIKLKIPRCKACDELIFTKEYTAAEGATFHIKHFCCYNCDEPLAGQQYIPDEKSNMPLCLKCYEDYFADSCQLCKFTIAGQGIAWNNLHWHADCFLCAGNACGKSLIGGRFCVKENLPFCSPGCVRSIIK